jgi:hypothetical protein
MNSLDTPQWNDPNRVSGGDGEHREWSLWSNQVADLLSVVVNTLLMSNRWSTEHESAAELLVDTGVQDPLGKRISWPPPKLVRRTVIFCSNRFIPSNLNWLLRAV